MRLVEPWWLLAALPAVLVVLAVGRNGRRSVPARQNRVAIALRVAGVVVLVLALTQPLVVRASPEKSVLFLLDRSSSITPAARDAQEEFVAEAVAQAGDTDQTAVAVFGKEVRLDEALAIRRTFDSVRTVVDESATDLAGALRGAAAVMPTEGSRRIVVMTDAVETVGDARSAIAGLADLGIAVDVIQLDTGRSSDALVTRVDAPVTARADDIVPVEVTVQSTTSGPGAVRVSAGDTSIEVPVDLVAGRNDIRVEVPASELGALRIRAEVEAAFDAVRENNAGEALVAVIGPPRIAVVEGVIDEAADLERALAAGGMEVDRLVAVPTAEELLVYDAVVVVNLPDPGDAVSADLASYVEDLGRGLVVVGGDRAFGLGGYEDSALEELLPVQSNPDDLIRRQPVAEVLVIDTSGSMADCHCGGGEHDISEQGGVNKTDISRAGAGLAIGALQPTDRVGVLAFTSSTRWALPLAQKPGAAVIEAALNSLTPQGDTEITPALQEALDELRDAPEDIRHIVLFTDGWGDDPGLLQVAQDIAAEGITLSVLGTGEGSGETLRRMAALGGGQFYPGRDLPAIPEIFVEETLRVARPLIAEGVFVPSRGAVSQVTAGLTSAPPLRGYVLTNPKATATVALEVGPGDPLLASWQRGLGRASVWTSDATTRWSADWIGWAGFTDFWGRLVRDVLPPGLDTPPEVRIDGGRLEIAYEAAVPLDAVAIAQVRDSEGTVSMIALQRSTETRFEGRVPVAARGAYWVAVRVEDETGTIASGSSGVVAGYADEFAFRDPDPQLAADLAAATDGRVAPVAAAIYEPAPLVGAAERPLWPFLAAVAFALFLADVALRRLVVARGDLEIWREQLTPTRKEPVEAMVTAPLGAEDEGPVQDREVHPEEETLGRLLRRRRT